MDYCPFEIQLQTSSNSGNCRGLEKQPTFTTEGLQEEVGLDSRCIDGDFVPDGSQPYQRATCHTVTCDGDTATISIGSI